MFHDHMEMTAISKRIKSVDKENKYHEIENVESNGSY